MDVQFEDADLYRTCNRRLAMARRWGDDAATAIGQHLQELEAVETLADMAQLPHIQVTHQGVDGEAAVEATSGVRIGLRWDSGHESGDPEDAWGGGKGIGVER